MALYGAIALAVIAAIFAFFALRATGGGGGSDAAARVDVVVASQHINAGDEITEGMLKVSTLSEDSLIENGLKSVDGLVGLVARYPIEQGQQVTQNNFGRLGEEAGVLGQGTLNGFRSVPISVNEEKVFGGLLSPGDRVDVVGVVQRTVGDEDVPTAVLLAQNAEVQSVGETYLEPVASLDAGGAPIESDTSTGTITEDDRDTEAQPDAQTVSVLVGPEDALKIILAQEEGSVWLILRAPGDDATVPALDLTIFPVEAGSSSGSSGD
jgi:pilus assembly protein CpaB